MQKAKKRKTKATVKAKATVKVKATVKAKKQKKMQKAKKRKKNEKNKNKFLKNVTKHRPQTNKPARMRNRDRETRMKWDDRSTLFPDGLRLKAPVRSQHHDVRRAHACRETTIQGVLTRTLDRWHRIRMSELDVKGEAFLPPARHSRVFLSPARFNCARKPDSNQLLPKKKRNKQPRHNSVCGSHSSSGSWPGSTRGSIKQHNYFKQLPSNPKLRTVSPTWPARRASSTHLPPYSHWALSAVVIVLWTPKIESPAIELPRVSNDPSSDNIPLQSRQAISPHDRRLFRETLFHQKRVYPQHFNCSTAHGVQFRLTTAQRIRCLSPWPTCHTASCQQHHSTCHRSALSQTRPISICHPTGIERGASKQCDLRQLVPRHVLQAVPLRIANQVGALTETTNVPLVFGSTSALLVAAESRLRLDLSHQQWHTSLSSLPAQSLAQCPRSTVDWSSTWIHWLSVPASNPEISPAACRVPGTAHLSRAWCVPCLLSIRSPWQEDPQSRNRPCDAWSTCAHAHYCVHRGLVHFGAFQAQIPQKNMESCSSAASPSMWTPPSMWLSSRSNFLMTLHFWKTGWSTFAKILQHSQAGSTKLLIDGYVRPYTAAPCASAFLQVVRMNGTWLPRECGLGFLRATSRLKSVRLVSGLAWIRTAHSLSMRMVWPFVAGSIAKTWHCGNPTPECSLPWETQRRGLSWSAMVIVYASLWCMPSGTCTCSRDQTTSTGTVISTFVCIVQASDFRRTS